MNPTCRARVEAGDSNEAVKASARGLLLWKAALARGLLPDDVALAQLAADVDSPVYGWPLAALRWPDEPLRAVLIRALALPLRWVLLAPRFCLATRTQALPWLRCVPGPCELALPGSLAAFGMLLPPCAPTVVRRTAGALSQLGVARFCKKYPAVLDALLRTQLELICKYQKTVLGCGACSLNLEGNVL